MPSSECYCAARIVFSVDLSIWFIRSLDIFAAIKRLGPKLVMIGEMVNNLIDFFLLSFQYSFFKGK
jgi:transient receptor potential cation channel subfamily M protein 2